MSHQPERKEKNCLNCGTTVIGRYCHVCGQENIVTRESFWSLTKHFVYDILHFDGKFWHTLKYLFIRPGIVAKEYCEGKRSSYLHPIRMYLFTSAVFFLFFFATSTPSLETTVSGAPLTGQQRLDEIKDYEQRIEKDSGDYSAYKILERLKDTSRTVTEIELIAMDERPVFSVQGKRYHSVKEYDSIQNSMPSEQRDSWFKHLLLSKAFKFNEKYKGRRNEGIKIFFAAFLHRLPYMLFLSLPFFALILKLLYARRRNFFYNDHAIFTLYHYIFSFILMLLVIGILKIQSWTNVGDLDWVALVFVLVWIVYLLLEMKNFYRQGWTKTLVKFFLVNLMGLFVIFLLFFGFLLFSIFEL